MNKKAQIFGEPFIFIFAIVVAAMVLMFGIKIYYDLSERADFAQVADIVQRINEDITTFYNLEEGSGNKFTFTFPNSIECFCFIQDPSLTEPLNYLVPINLPSPRCNENNFKTKLMNEGAKGRLVFWKYNEKKIKGENPASLPYKALINSKFVVQSDNNPLCIDLVASKHRLSIRLESQGNQVLIEKV